MIDISDELKPAAFNDGTDALNNVPDVTDTTPLPF